MSSAAAPRFGHVGITVPSLDDAVAWYRDVLDLTVLVGPVEVTADDDVGGAMASDVFGERFRRLRQAHLLTRDGCAVELFEFLDPPTEVDAQPFAYWRTGCFHLCLVDPDLDARVARIRAGGGRQRTAIWTMRPGEPFRMCYCEDPFGTIIELYSHSHAEAYAATAADGPEAAVVWS